MSTARSWRRWVIAAGTAHYDHLDPGDWLPAVEAELDQVTGLLCTRFGYRQALADCAIDPTSDQLRRWISGWLSDPERHEDDVVVIYYSGHGVTHGGRHYLLTRDSREGNLAGTALATDELVWMLGEDSPVQHLLVMVDTCYAGRGGLDMGRVAAQLVDHRRTTTGQGTGWWFLAAARPREEAAQGAFAAALTAAAQHPRAGAAQPYIALEDLVDQINAVLRRDGRGQQARLGAAESAGLPPFLSNPWFAGPSVPGDDLVDRSRLRHHRRLEHRDHWDPRSRGGRFTSPRPRSVTGVLIRSI